MAARSARKEDPMVPRSIAATLAALALFASSCAEEAAAPPVHSYQSAGEGTFPVTVDAANGAVEIAEEPAAIVSLSATATEMLFAVGAGDQVEAVDDTSNFPPDAPATKLSAYEPNVEAIAAYEPDLVVISDDINDLVASLEALDIPVLVEPAAVTLEDTYDQIEDLGLATGHELQSLALATQMQSDIQDIVAAVPSSETAPTYYHELDPTFFTATSRTFIGQLYSLLGLQNIADPADEDGSGYPQLSAEYIVKADPDLIFLADTECCGESAETVAERPGWDRISAVQADSVVELDDDIASRWGPRVVEFLQIAAAAVSDLDAA
jgi:iron complex transport system substrate-binding protein